MATTDPTKLLVLLVNGDFEVHKRLGCRMTGRTRDKHISNKFEWEGTNQFDIVLGLWDDQIAEAEYADDPEEAYRHMAGATIFHGCVSLPERENASPPKRKAKRHPVKTKEATDRAVAEIRAKRDEAKPVKMTREQKTQLATVVVTAAASIMDQLDGVGLKDADPAEVARTISQWLHHLPVDRARWPEALPKPNRSDWR